MGQANTKIKGATLSGSPIELNPSADIGKTQLFDQHFASQATTAQAKPDSKNSGFSTSGASDSTNFTSGRPKPLQKVLSSNCMTATKTAPFTLPANAAAIGATDSKPCPRSTSQVGCGRALGHQ